MNDVIDRQRPSAPDLALQSRAPSNLLINREHTRQFLLATAKKNRAHKFTRVSEETLRLANEMLRQWCIGHVNRMPSKGRTL